MDKKELLESLLEHYTKVISQVQEAPSLEDAKDILYNEAVDKGACYCAISKFRTDIYCEKWVKGYIIDERSIPSGFWGMPPIWGKTKEEVIALLQVRIDIFKKELSWV